MQRYCAMAAIEGSKVHGVEVDAAGRCAHYHGPHDVLALRMHCCGEFYACRECHDAIAGHPATLWPLEAHDTLALRCGVCGESQRIAAYLAASDCCPSCKTLFNRGCRRHHHLYFVPGTPSP